MWQARHVKARQGAAGHGEARLGEARFGAAWNGRQGAVRCGMDGWGQVWRGVAG